MLPQPSPPPRAPANCQEELKVLVPHECCWCRYFSSNNERFAVIVQVVRNSEGWITSWTSLLMPSTRKKDLSALGLKHQTKFFCRYVPNDVDSNAVWIVRFTSVRFLFRSAFKNSSSSQAQFALSFFTTLLRPDANAALALLGLFGSFYLKRDPIRLYFLFLCMCVYFNA